VIKIHSKKHFISFSPYVLLFICLFGNLSNAQDLQDNIILQPQGLEHTGIYSLKNIERKWACMHPKINGDGTLQPPKGAERYTFFYFLLNRKTMTEKMLVNRVLSIYFVIGFLVVCIGSLGLIM